MIFFELLVFLKSCKDDNTGLHLGSKIGVFVKIEPLEDTFQTFFSILKEWILSFKTNSEVIREIGLSRLDLLRRGNGGRFGDEEVTAFADLWRVVPVMSTMVIYWTCYSQVGPVIEKMLCYRMFSLINIV